MLKIFRRRPLPVIVPTTEDVMGAKILRDAVLYLWETTQELHRNERAEDLIDYSMAVGRREAILILRRLDETYLSFVPRGGVL